MIFHLGFELPEPRDTKMDETVAHLTEEETTIIKQQIRKNSDLIKTYIERLDLLVNQERYPQREKFIEKIRERLYLLMEENDTFRKVLWKHMKKEQQIQKAA